MVTFGGYNVLCRDNGFITGLPCSAGPQTSSLPLQQARHPVLALGRHPCCPDGGGSPGQEMVLAPEPNRPRQQDQKAAAGKSAVVEGGREAALRLPWPADVQ